MTTGTTEYTERQARVIGEDGEIFDSIEENPLVARKLAHAFALFTDLVEHMPEIAPVWKENSRYRIWSGIYPYKIFYVIDEQEEQIFISAVRHGKRQNPYLP